MALRRDREEKGSGRETSEAEGHSTWGLTRKWEARTMLGRMAVSGCRLGWCHMVEGLWPPGGASVQMILLALIS